MGVSTRMWAAGCAGAVVLIAAGGWFVGVQPQLDHAAQVDAAAQSVETQIGANQAQVGALSKLAASQSKMEARAVVLGKAVPSTLQSNTFSRRMNAVAALDGVTIQSWSSGEATAYTPPAGAAAPAAAAPATSPSASASASAAPAPVVSAAPVLAKTDSRITGADFTVIPTTVVVKGPADAGMRFIKDMQGDERLFLVAGYSTAVDEQDASSVTTTLNGYIYALKA